MPNHVHAVMDLEDFTKDIKNYPVTKIIGSLKNTLP